MQKKYAEIILLLAGTAITAAFVFHASEPFIKKVFPAQNIQERKAIEKLASTIRENYNGPKKVDRKINLRVYHSNKAPLVGFENHDRIIVASYLAGETPVVKFKKSPDFFVGKKVPRGLRKKIELISKIKLGKETFKLWRVKK